MGIGVVTYGLLAPSFPPIFEQAIDINNFFLVCFLMILQWASVNVIC